MSPTAARAVVVLAAFTGTRPGRAVEAFTRPCREPHYRWSEKTDTSLMATGVPRNISIGVVLGHWAPPGLTSHDWCAPRAGRELLLYSVRGWLRRVETAKDDGDWHLELTDRPQSPLDSCLVAEIPPGELGAAYRQARADLATALGHRKMWKRGMLAEPLEVRIVGAAFFDGHHRPTTRPEAINPRHGDCNSSLRALWELHPVYRVERLEKASGP
jgi:hypothetical protein